MSKEEQIEEMVKDLCEIHCKGFKCEVCDMACEYRMLAEALYNIGYRKQSGWISAENPPDEYRDEYGELIPFLVCCQGTVYPFRAMYDGTNWGDGIGVLKVTHWMPLPEPPKGLK